ncbi:peptidase M48 [[Phormidium ambiguum] IAM M-71]|uniref:Peptidase M48 n=1 Tax=[Phormidium ambiguum] IAM M-71 TaxID=454136 RepID=A0A1U7IJC6_9CYAN|nr:zinc metalloprotease HtpX [Phormidium ambiguum]OKH37297.1 peptidase M48 [Phormidium ambiguum IAM M-71]
MSLQAGIEAIKQKRYQEAINLLEKFCGQCLDDRSEDYLRARMWLVAAYQKTNQNQKAIALCQQLSKSTNPKVSQWAQQTLESLNSSAITNTKQRATGFGVKLAMAGVAGNLAFASMITMTLLFGMVFVLALAVVFIYNSENPGLGLGIAIAFTLIFNLAAFFLSPFIMDLTQSWLYKTRWIDLAELKRKSPETAAVIQRVCAEKNLKQPRLGIIDDQNPTAFTYGSLPNSARLVVSEGLFTYLKDDEIATVYAHELGHIVHWDFAVMTVAATLVQICYLLYVFLRELGRGEGNNSAKDAAGGIALAAYLFYLIGTYLILYLSRTREYFADHFAAETTGNPNALSRALVKIAYGILEESQQNKEPSKLIEGTRALGIFDHKGAAATGTAYRAASRPEQIGRVFLWDMFNPWGWWMELNSTHPLTGKRVRALSTYAEQLGLETEFDMSRVVREGKTLKKGKLYGNFVLDICLYTSQLIGFLAGLAIGFILLINAPESPQSLGFLLAFPLIGLGIGTLLKTFVTYPNFSHAADTDVITLMSDPYASPLRGKPAKLQGKLIGRGDAGYAFGSDLMLQERSGLMYLHYASRFGAIGNFLFGMNRVKNLIGSEVNTLGWFRRGIGSWMDLISLESKNGTIVKSYHRFWALVFGSGAIISGLVIILFVRG